MSRLSIEVSEQQHQKIKALAALNGNRTIKEYILEKTLPDTESKGGSMTEGQALKQLETFLMPRIQEAERGDFSTLTMEEILSKAHSQYLE